MSDIKLFKLTTNDTTTTQVTELPSQWAKLERDLQKLIEQQMGSFLGVRFLASEYTTTNKGRIDSLGLDENNCPVIIEYKRHANQNVINQGLFYLNWLLDHKGDFQLLVMEQLGKEIAENIEWTGARLICIASDFNRYDEHAIQLIDRNIELMRYKYFGEALLLLELVNTQAAKSSRTTATPAASSTTHSDNPQPNNSQILNPEQLSLYNAACDYCESLGDEVQRKELKHYTAFKRIKNFASIIQPSQKSLRLNLYLKVNPSTIALEEGFTRDVTNKGHWGTGDLEVVVRSLSDLNKAKSLIEQSYLNN